MRKIRKPTLPKDFNDPEQCERYKKQLQKLFGEEDPKAKSRKPTNKV